MIVFTALDWFWLVAFLLVMILDLDRGSILPPGQALTI